MTTFAIVVVFIATLGHSTFGFGGGLIATPILGLVFGVKSAVILALVLQVGTGLLIFRTYKTTQWDVALKMIFGLYTGIALGTLGLESFSEIFLRYFLSIFIFVFLAKSIFRPDLSFGFSKSTLHCFGGGLVAGVIQGLTGTGGPILVMFLAEILKDKLYFRSTLIFLLFSGNLVRLIFALYQGLFTPELSKLALIIIPGMLLAVALGQTLHNFISEKAYRRAVHFILFCSATMLLVVSPPAKSESPVTPSCSIESGNPTEPC